MQKSFTPYKGYIMKLMRFYYALCHLAKKKIYHYQELKHIALSTLNPICIRY